LAYFPLTSSILNFGHILENTYQLSSHIREICEKVIKVLFAPDIEQETIKVLLSLEIKEANRVAEMVKEAEREGASGTRRYSLDLNASQLKIKLDSGLYPWR